MKGQNRQPIATYSRELFAESIGTFTLGSVLKLQPQQDRG